MMQPNCRVCGQFIAESDLWNADSVECCKEHGFIKICGSCIEIFETYGKSEDLCIMKFVKDYRPLFSPMFHARHACPNCDYIRYTFIKTANHMASKNHLYNGVGTYPIFVAPKLRSNLIPHNPDSLKELADYSRKTFDIRAEISK